MEQVKCLLSAVTEHNLPVFNDPNVAIRYLHDELTSSEREIATIKNASQIKAGETYYVVQPGGEVVEMKAKWLCVEDGIHEFCK